MYRLRVYLFPSNAIIQDLGPRFRLAFYPALYKFIVRALWVLIHSCFGSKPNLVLTIYIYISQRFQGVSFGVYNIWFFGFFMLYAILENSLRICLVLLLRNKSETIVKGIVTNFEGFKLFCLNYIC